MHALGRLIGPGVQLVATVLVAIAAAAVVSGPAGAATAVWPSPTVSLSSAALPNTGSSLHGPVSPSAAEPGGGSFGIQLLDAPLTAQDDPRARQYIVDHLIPGTVISRRILVVNKSERALDLDLYPAAATIGDEQFQFATDRTGNELTGWITLAQDLVSLQPHSEQEVLATIQVPSTASKGERYGVIWASNASQPATGGVVAQVNRTGIRVYLDVGPGGDPVTDFQIGRFTALRSAEGIPSLAIEVTNTGERALDMAGSMNLIDGPAGLRAGPFLLTGVATLTPGQTGTVAFDLPADIPNGPWTAEADLSSGKVAHSASTEITFPDPGRIAPSAEPSKTPWLLIGASVIVVAVLILLVVMLSRRSQRAALS